MPEASRVKRLRLIKFHEMIAGLKPTLLGFEGQYALRGVHHVRQEPAIYVGEISHGTGGYFLCVENGCDARLTLGPLTEQSELYIVV